MRLSKTILSILCSVLVGLNILNAQQGNVEGLDIVFVENSVTFTETEKETIDLIIVESESAVRALFPGLPKDIKVIVEAMPRNIDQVGGTTGRAQRLEPYGEVYIYISSVYPGGVEGAAKASLSSSIHHEFHHLARGWVVEGNKFGPGIDIAMINEGLAVVFMEEYSGQVFEGNSIPTDVEKWVEEVLALPKDANYNTWMNQHPDGRMGIGYRSGNFVIRQAIENSGKNVLELSELQPEEILMLARY